MYTDVGNSLFQLFLSFAISAWVECSLYFFFSSRRRHTRLQGDWSSDVCSSDLSLVELGRDSEAIPHLETSLASSPEDTAVLYSLGLAYLRVGRPELLQIIFRLSQLPAGLAASHLLSGQRLLAGGEYERSISELDEAAKLNPALPRLHYSLGLAQLKLGRNVDALASLKSE